MQIRNLLFIAITPLYVYSSFSDANENVVPPKKVEQNAELEEWGSWAIDSGENPRRYGSGIVGNDENILHELDRSNLLDYDSHLDQGLMPELPSSEELSSEPALGDSQ